MRGDKLRTLVLWGGRYKKKTEIEKNQLQSFENVSFLVVFCKKFFADDVIQNSFLV